MIPLSIIILPVVLLKNLSGLRYMSLVSFVIILYTIIIAVIETPNYYKHYKNDKDYNVEFFIRPFELNWLQGIATLSLSYICHPLFFNIRKELVLSNPRRAKKVATLSIVFMITIYCFIVIAGYISLGQDMQPSLYILRRTFGGYDILMKIAQVGFLIVV